MTGRIAYFLIIMPIVLTTLGVSLVIALRWFSHKERMAMISQNIPLQTKSPEEKRRYFLASGVLVGMIGLAISLGLFTIGTGPWLLYGLLPFFAGLAIVLAGLIVGGPKEKSAPVTPTLESAEGALAASTESTWTDLETDNNQKEEEEML